MIDSLCQSVCQHLDPITAIIMMLFSGAFFMAVGFLAVAFSSKWLKERGWFE